MLTFSIRWELNFLHFLTLHSNMNFQDTWDTRFNTARCPPKKEIRERGRYGQKLLHYQQQYLVSYLLVVLPQPDLMVAARRSQNNVNQQHCIKLLSRSWINMTAYIQNFTFLHFPIQEYIQLLKIKASWTSADHTETKIKKITWKERQGEKRTPNRTKK